MKRILYAVFALAAFFAASGCQEAAECIDLKLWYDEPAEKWVEALPVGNGRLGAMVFGSPSSETLQLNEETVWAGQPNSNANPNIEEGALDQIRKLIFEGRYREDILQDKSWNVIPDCR